MRIDSFPNPAFAPEQIPELTTRRLDLLIPRMDSGILDDLFEIYSDQEAGKFNRWIPMQHRDEMTDRLARWIAEREEGSKFKWCIRMKTTNKVVGDITLFKFDLRWQEVEVGFNLNAAFWRQGIMTEALETVTHFAFMQLKLARVSAHVHCENTASLALLKKFNFTSIGQFRASFRKESGPATIRLFHLDKLTWLSKRTSFREYEPSMQPHFERINTPWLREYGYLNQGEIDQLRDPEQYLLKGGGQILFLEWDGKVIGTGCLKINSHQNLELVKFAVDEGYRSHGFGVLLLRHIISLAKSSAYPRLELYSHRELHAALKLYRAFGFTEVPLPEDDVYCGRCDIRMGLTLKE